MKILRRLGIAVLSLIMLMSLTACKPGEERYELSNYMGKSVSSFERKSVTKLEEQSSGVYIMEGVVQVLVPDKKVTSITLLKDAGKYTLFGVTIGMTKTAVEKLLADSFGKETSKSTDSGNNTVIYSYLKEEKQLYITYDRDSKKVVAASYYKISGTQPSTAAASDTEDSGETMLMIGDTRVYYNEAMVYLKLAQDKYEADYGSGIWEADILGNGATFGSMIKQEVINQITELKVISAEAYQQDIALTEEEQADANSYAKEQYKSFSKEELQQYHITEKLLQQVYYDNLLANKMFEKLTINVDNNVPDEDAKQITVQDIFIQNYNLDSEGDQVALSKEDKEAAYEKVQSLLVQAKETEDFKALAEENSQAEEIEYTFGKEGGPKAFGDEFEKAALALKTGELSTIVTTTSGWHIIYCVSDFNEDATTQVKEEIIEQRRNDMFSELYSEWSANYKVVVNQEAWDAISLN